LCIAIGWAEEVASYSIPAGDVWSDGLTLDDEGYDGVAVAPPDGPDSNRTRRWSRGLGTLTDGLYGLDNFRISLGARKGEHTATQCLGGSVNSIHYSGVRVQNKQRYRFYNELSICYAVGAHTAASLPLDHR